MELNVTAYKKEFETEIENGYIHVLACTYRGELFSSKCEGAGVSFYISLRFILKKITEIKRKEILCIKTQLLASNEIVNK